MRYEAVFIDWNGTLSTSEFWSNVPYYAEVQVGIFGADHPLIQDWMLGKLSAETATHQIATICGLDYNTLLKDLTLSAREVSLAEPTILKTISQLRKHGIKVVIATDNMDTFHRWTAPTLKLNNHFDAILNSAQIGALKSQPETFFGSYLANVKVDPSHCLLIDDSSDSQAIERMGIGFRQISQPSDVQPILSHLLKTLTL